MPESVLREEDPVAPAAHDASDAGLRIAAIGIVDRQRETGAKKLSTRPGPTAAEFPRIEIGCENQFVIAGRIVPM